MRRRSIRGRRVACRHGRCHLTWAHAAALACTSTTPSMEGTRATPSPTHARTAAGKSAYTALILATTQQGRAATCATSAQGGA